MNPNRNIKRLSLICSLALGTGSLFAQPFFRAEETVGFTGLYETAGVSVADIDGDFDLDVFIVAKADYATGISQTQSRLFRNEDNGTFTDITTPSGLTATYDYDSSDPGWDYGVKMGAAWGDFDNDGFPDLFLTGLAHNRLYHNQGNGTFADITSIAGLETNEGCYFSSALWWDYDQDGLLDLYVSKWGLCAQNHLYRNLGDGTFERQFNVGLDSREAKTWMAVSLDINQDHRPDLYLANDFGVNELFIQQADGRFIESASDWGMDKSGSDMGISLGDYNNDGSFELFITNIAENRLLVSHNPGQYADEAEAKGILNSFWAWGTRFGDFDLDGDEDLFVVNGYQHDQVYFPVWKTNFLYKNLHREGQDSFIDWSQTAQVRETSHSLSMETFDYDDDGDLDVLVSNSDDRPFFYENKAIDANPAHAPNWVSIRLEGSLSNRDALGAELTVYCQDTVQYRYHHGAGLLSHSLKPLHLGLAAADQIDSLHIRWPSGLEETHKGLPVNTLLYVIEQGGFTSIDLGDEKIRGCTDPQSCSYNPEAVIDDGSCSYLAPHSIQGPQRAAFLQETRFRYPGTPSSRFRWRVEGGEIIRGQGSPEVWVKWHIAEKGRLSVQEIASCYSPPQEIELNLFLDTTDTRHGIARLWNEALLHAIRGDYARPTVHARNLFHASIAMYDAWAVQSSTERPYLLGQALGAHYSPFDGFSPGKSLAQSRQEAISYAAYRLLSYRFRNSPGQRSSQAVFDLLMSAQGFDAAEESTDYSSGHAAALGNYIADQVIQYGLQDGARESADYANTVYTPANPPLPLPSSGNTSLHDPNRWQPLALETFIDQSGNLIPGSTPDFLSPEWGQLSPFSLQQDDLQQFYRDGAAYTVYHDPAAPPYLDTTSRTASSAQYQWGFAMVSAWGAQLDPADSVMWDISPGRIGHISLEKLPTDFEDYPEFYRFMEGGDIGQGYPENPVTGQAYAPQWVPRGDYARVLAEFWADGPDSETPPGHWFVLLNTVSDHPLFEKRWAGEGATLSPLEWELKSYLTLGGAMHDAAIAAWSIKGWYDYIRPVSALRYMARRGQSTDPALPRYDPGGIPLIAGRIELIQAGDSLAGPNNEHLHAIKLYSWRGHRFINDPGKDRAGVGWIRAADWMPYQRPSFVTPPFAGYVSGHSTFSRAAAEVMSLMTGSPYFPGGMGEFVAAKDDFLVFEAGPSQEVVLQWASYRDASDQCSLSRIWGGIHPPADDIPGRLIGAQIGQKAFRFAQSYFEEETDVYSQPTVFPNPSRTDQSVSLQLPQPELPLHLFDLQGREMSIYELKYHADQQLISFKLDHLPAGIYLLKNGPHSWKIIRQ